VSFIIIFGTLSFPIGSMGVTRFCNPSNTQGEVTSQSLWSRYDRHFVGITRHNAFREYLSCYSNKIESVSLRKCPYDH